MAINTSSIKVLRAVGIHMDLENAADVISTEGIITLGMWDADWAEEKWGQVLFGEKMESMGEM